MIIFNEEQYAKDILKNYRYRTKKNRGIERCVLTRYLTQEGKSNNEIKDILNKMSYGEFSYLKKEDKYKIFDKIINKANLYNFIKDINVTIYKSEIEQILKVQNQNARDLLFVSLVYYKWGYNIDYYKFYSKNMNKILVEERDRDLWTLAKLNSLKMRDRSLAFYDLIKNKLYINCGFKDKNYFYIPFSVNSGDVAFIIDNYDDLILWLYSYLNRDDYQKCEECGIWIKKARSPKKYCGKCSLNKQLEKKRRWKKKQKVDQTKILQTL